ncbi:MAG: EAL domain-containing protein [Pseudomonadota bacterium]|nr:EAL domain-containing protein [Pseudomonadota bacterium]
MSTNLTYAAEAASSRTLEALAQVIQALAPEVSSVSFHDFAADTLWLSDDFLLPEDHKLVEDSISGDSGTNMEFTYAPREDGNYSLAIPVRDGNGAINGAVRLSIDAGIRDTRTDETLQQKLAPVFTCLSAEFERRQGFPLLISEDTHEGTMIQNALHSERYELFLQPICSLHDNAGLAHYEVLLRLRTADGSLITPKEFFERAAQQRLMPSIDRWVVRTLLVWLAKNRKLWSRVPSVFSVNLSAQSITDERFISFVEACVVKTGIPPNALCFDITERHAASGNIGVKESMRRLEVLGCEVALDDFGANSPTYGYLRSIPAHYFKIDSSLVGAAPNDRVARAMISAIVRMASDLGVQTVAESVESDVQLQAVRSLGVDFAQGYWLGRPKSLTGFDFSPRPSSVN